MSRISTGHFGSGFYLDGRTDMYSDADDYMRMQIKHHREERLQSWIEMDLAAGDTSCSGALIKWRNDMLPRLKFKPPCTIKIPKCFLAVCNLQKQDVLLKEDGSVWTIPDEADPDAAPRMLVPEIKTY